MKKLALIGAVSALALVCGQALATDLEVGVQDVLVPVDQSIAVNDALNNNALFSGNSYSDDDSLTANDNQLLSNNTSTHTFSSSYSWTANTAVDNSINVEIDDVMVNATILGQSVSGAGVGYPMYGTPALASSEGRGGPDHGDAPSFTAQAWTGDITNVQFDGNRGIYGANFNTGQAAQMNSVSINAKVAQ